MERRFQQLYIHRNPTPQNSKKHPNTVENVGLKSCTKQKQRFFFTIYNCPKSLKLMVQFYRLLGYSFSGTTFTDKTPKIKSKTKTAKFFKTFNLTGFLLILFNIFFCIIKSYGPMFLMKAATKVHEKQMQNYTFRALPGEKQTIFSYFSLQHYDAEFADLKPILRGIMQSVLFVYLGEMTLIYLHHVISGGRLLTSLAAIPVIRSDGSSSDDQLLARKLFRYLFALLTAIFLLAFATFSQQRILEVLLWGLGYKHNLENGKRLVVLKLMVVGAVHYLNDLISSITPMLFLYSMIIFRQNIRSLKESVKKVDLDEVALVKIKHRLSNLSEHFSTVMSHFAFPLTVSLVSITILLVSSSCYLMIHQGNLSNNNNPMITFIFVYALVSFTRLLVICASGSLVTIVYRDLIRTIYESVPEWDLSSWMAFNEIRKLKRKFRVEIYSTYTVKQSAILAVLGFVLSYVVILLQTESYSGGGGSVQNSSTA